MKCWQVQRYLHAYLDQELAAELALEIEKHLLECTRCREQMDFEMLFIDRVRAELRTAEHDEELEARIRKALGRQERRNEGRRIVMQASVLAVAASLVLVVGILARHSMQRGRDLPHVGFSEEMIEKHTHTLPLEISGKDEAEVARWFDGRVPFPVQPPRFSPDSRARLVGARLSRIRERDAAHLVYDVNGHKLTFMIFDPGEKGKELEDLGKERVNVRRGAQTIPGRDGWITTHRGYSVGLFRREGITYSVASDLNQREIVRLISSMKD